MQNRGFSLIELIVVLSMVAALSFFAGSAIITHSSVDVRSIMDDLEGRLSGAQKLAVATSQDVTIYAQGNWIPALPNSLSLNYSTTGFNVSAVGGPDVDSTRQRAGVAAASGIGVDWWEIAMGTVPGRGKTNDDINNENPFKNQSGFKNDELLGKSELNLFQGGSTARTVTISGISKRFMDTFYIQVVGLKSGFPYAGSPMGLLVVQNNGGSIYKFYNPGLKSGDGKWRRI